jgi:hypothetical protein
MAGCGLTLVIAAVKVVSNLFLNDAGAIIAFPNGDLMYGEECCCCFCDCIPSSITLTIGASPFLTGDCAAWVGSWTMTYIEGTCAQFELTSGLPMDCSSLLGILTTSANSVGISILFTFPAAVYQQLQFWGSDTKTNCDVAGSIPTGINGDFSCTYFDIAVAVPGFNTMSITTEGC